MKRILFTLFILLVSNLSFAQSQQKETVFQLMDAMKITDNMNQMIDVMMKNPMFSSANIPQEFWDEFKAEFSSGELIQEIAAVYKKYYSEEEMVGLIQFYSSPIGQKTLEITPALTGETMQIGQKYGMQVVQKISEKLKAKGYTISQ
ncbi:DUF2059 domain-containing protein [Algoriphagus sp. CAU 1675]|uniref:DUF2059 domain-containing protein n=1 Tax=Algoriphagus sp. CAU 1675 TaxID=3032597 RepID=UPI0023DCB313|nr:DUF2059 domain-containing protein [Algoriphagus sp. CAU 1675]MDF2156789.1 DUF2059 domain-containing protein [Algoriphagus sp. CAU 1675]